MTEAIAATRPRGRCVGVVPVRCSEAWLLVDAGALLGAAGSRVRPERLELPSSAVKVESLPDPKETLRRAFGIALGKASPATPAEVGRYDEAIADRVDLARLASVPAWARLVTDTRAALVASHYLRS